MFAFRDVTVNGTTEEIIHTGGRIQIQIGGTPHDFDGATVQLEISQDGFPWFPVDESGAGVWTGSDDISQFTIKSGTLYRFNISGGGASLNLSGSVLS